MATGQSAITPYTTWDEQYFSPERTARGARRLEALRLDAKRRVAIAALSDSSAAAALDAARGDPDAPPAVRDYHAASSRS